VAPGYSAAERRALAEAVRRGEAPLRCPACGAALAIQPVRPRREVAYVRRRVWLLCPACRRTAALDLPSPPRGS